MLNLWHEISRGRLVISSKPRIAACISRSSSLVMQKGRNCLPDGQSQISDPGVSSGKPCHQMSCALSLSWSSQQLQGLRWSCTAPAYLPGTLDLLCLSQGLAPLACLPFQNPAIHIHLCEMILSSSKFDLGVTCWLLSLSSLSFTKKFHEFQPLSDAEVPTSDSICFFITPFQRKCVDNLLQVSSSSAYLQSLTQQFCQGLAGGMLKQVE